MTKSVAMIFTRKRKIGPLSLTINGSHLSFVNKFKYLGVIFNRTLSYKYHIDYVVSKCNKRLNLLKILSGTYWGAGKNTLLTLYRTLIRSALDYGMPAYFFASKSQLARLRKIQNQALRICCGAMKSTPICALQASCNEMPLELRHQYLCLNFKAKLMRLPRDTHPAQNLIEDSAEELYCFTEQTINTFNEYTKSPVFDHLSLEYNSSTTRAPWLLHRPVIDLTLSNRLSKNDIPELRKNIATEYVSENYINYLKVYTDGSKTPYGTGCSLYVPSLAIRHAERLTNNHSAYSCELRAIRHVLSWILDYLPRLKYVMILSDCQSALQALKNFDYDCNDKLILQTITDINKVRENGTDLVLTWIPGHVGIPGNEEADKLARNAVSGEISSVEEMCVSKSEAKTVIKQYCMEQWDIQYNQTESAAYCAVRNGSSMVLLSFN